MGYRFFFSLKNLRNHFLFIPCIAFSNETHNKTLHFCCYYFHCWLEHHLVDVNNHCYRQAQRVASEGKQQQLCYTLLPCTVIPVPSSRGQELPCLQGLCTLSAMTSWNTYFCWMAWTEKVLTCMETAFFLFSVTLPYPYLLSTQSSISRPEALDTQVCNCNGLESNENYRLAEKQHFSEWRCALGDCRCSEGCYLYISDFFFARVPLGHFVLHHPRSIKMFIASKLQLKDRVKVVVSGFAVFDGKGQEHCCLKLAQIPLSSHWVHLKSGGGRESSASFSASDPVLMFSKAPTTRITQCCRRVGPNESPGPRQWLIAVISAALQSVCVCVCVPFALFTTSLVQSERDVWEHERSSLWLIELILIS